jgi:hypothetical protein
MPVLSFPISPFFLANSGKAGPVFLLAPMFPPPFYIILAYLSLKVYHFQLYFYLEYFPFVSSPSLHFSYIACPSPLGSAAKSRHKQWQTPDC